MKVLNLLILFLFSITIAHSQIIRPADLVVMKRAEMKRVNLLSIDNQRSTSVELDKLSAFTLLSVDKQSMKKLPSAMKLSIPLAADDLIEVQLVEVNLFSDDHLAIDEPSGRLITTNPGMHYRGIIKDMPNSLVALSFYDDELSGFISYPKHAGNFVLGKLKDAKKLESKHIVYLDTDLTFDKMLSCSTTDEGEKYTKAELQSKNNRVLSDCVRLLLEVDYNLHQELVNSTAASNNYLNTLFNQVATIHASENINTTLSASFVWSSPSPYSGSSAGAILNTYQNSRNNFNADFAQLLTNINFGGIAATINGVCKTENSRMCVSGVLNDLETVPTFSFDVEIACHEYGHLFGSLHTHG